MGSKTYRFSQIFCKAIQIAIALAGLSAAAQTNTALSKPTLLPDEKLKLSPSAVRVKLEPPLKKITGEYRFEVGGANYAEGMDEAVAAYTIVDLKFKAKLAQILGVHFRPRVGLASARVQARFEDDNWNNRIGLFDAFVHLDPIEYYQLRAGVLHQGFLGNSMLVSGFRSFAGVQNIIKYEGQPISARLVLQNAIPNSNTLNTERQEREKLPTFTTQSLELSGQNPFVDWRLIGGAYKWSNIPNTVAFESTRLGNEPECAGGSDCVLVPSATRLRFQHQGLFGTAATTIGSQQWPITFNLEYQRIHNTEAPSDSADAQLWGIGPNIKFAGMEVHFIYRKFLIESDATVAAYGRSRFGNTNRIGEMYDLRLAFPKHKFDVFTELSRAGTINADLNQRNVTTIYIGLETDYASIF